MVRQRRCSIHLAFIALLNAFPLIAQNNDQMNAGIQFNFSNPGARSLAIAGAFTSVADDATAAYTNPAGLTILPRKEVSIEGRIFDFSTPYTNGGRFSGTPTGMGIDTVGRLTIAEANDRTHDLSFLSYVHPWRKMTIAVYRHQLAKYRATFRSEGAFIAYRGSILRLFPTAGRVDLSVVNTGGAVALNATRHLSLGMNFSRYSGKMTGMLNRYFRGLMGTTGVDIGEFFGPPKDTPDNVHNYSDERGRGGQWKMSVGALWQVRRFSAGVVFRPGPSIPVLGQRFSGPADPTHPVNSFLSRPIVSPFRVPDVYGAGMTFRLTETFRMAVDFSRVRYSQMVRHLENIGDFSEAGELRYYHVNDGTELRLGVEQVITPSLFLRLGYWSDPDHRIRYDGPNPVELANWRAGRRVSHYTAGGGWVLGEGDYQIDVAADVSATIRTISLSSVARF